MLSSILEDVRYGVRMLLKAPLLSLVAALSLAAGVAAITTTFSVAHGFLLAPFPYADQDRLVIIWEKDDSDTDEDAVAPANFLDWRDQASVFSGMEAYSIGPVNLTGGDEPERVRAVGMTPGTLALLGREPFLGRDFRPEEGIEGARDVVVLAYGFWQRYLGQDSGVLGRTLTLDGVPHTIVGVMSEDFDFLPADVDVFRPTDLEEHRNAATSRAERDYLVLARLEENQTVDRARAELTAIAKRLQQQHPETNEGVSVVVQGLREFFPGRTDTILMYILLTVAAFVLLIACANIANLLLARAESRQKEIALRTALGAGRVRVLRQLLTESVLLALVGGAIGVAVSAYTIRFVSESMPAQLPRSFMPALDGPVLFFALAVSVLAGLTFGIAPAFHSLSEHLRETLTEGSRGGTGGRGRSRLRSAFVVAELAAALALLIAAGAVTEMFDRLIMRAPGFDETGILTAQLSASEDRYPDDAAIRSFYREVARRVRDLPGVTDATLMSQLPRSRNVNRAPFTFSARPSERRNEAPEAFWQAVDPHYFDALGVTLSRGRALGEADREDAALVAVVNDTFVTRYMADEEPIGSRIDILGASREIVGVSRDIFHTRMPVDHGLGAFVYLPMAQQPERNMSLALRTTGEPTTLGPELRAAIWAVDPAQPVSGVQTLVQHIDTELAGPAVIALVLSIFGGAALFLAAMGIYGVMAYNVGHRTREIGIRMALGAKHSNVVSLMTHQGMKLLALGMAVGAPMAWAMLRAILAAFESDGDVVNPVLVASVTALLVGVAFFATYLPARRASRIHPVSALRAE